MPRLLFTKEKTNKSIGFIGGNVNLNEILYPKIPETNIYQTHLFTLLPSFFKHTCLLKENQRISVFISLEHHKLGGVKESVTSKYTVNQKSDLGVLDNNYSKAVLYDFDESANEIISNIVLPKKYFEVIDNDDDFLEKEHLFFEENGMGLDISKKQGIPFYEQDIIRLSPKYQFYLQLLGEDIEKEFNIFQNGIGYFYLDKNIKKLKSGNDVGLFFIQNT